MRLTPRYPGLSLAIGATTWFAVGAQHAILIVLAHGDRQHHAPPPAWWLLFGVFGLAMFVAIQLRLSRALQTLLIGLEAASVVAMAGLFDHGGPGSLLVTVALQLSLLRGARSALAWIVVQSILLRLALWSSMADVRCWLEWGLDLAFQVIAVGAVQLLRREAETGQALSRINAELRATQVLLSESAAAAERVRISRDLHDAWGHDLTALSLQLEYAVHVLPEPGRQKVAVSRDLAKALLAKVRDVVGTLRRYEGSQIRPVLEALAAGAPQLAIHLDVPATLARQPSDVAQTLMRSTQEIITNTLRHAGAQNLWLALRDDEEGVWLDCRDDGSGTDRLKLGLGLTGLSERFEQLGGRIAFQTARGGGFRVAGWLPPAPPFP
ncbi:sensor histidine kinase [Phenylobacterium sp.]|jgi:signal transduction histidine kinase|uniref:sensor histidine kinase n=1 Tax=Phenylobacterium sp. TaxID=1871053 RepID=UPI002F426797